MVVHHEAKSTLYGKKGGVMTFAEGALRFILGGTLVVVIGVIAKSGRSSIAGIIAMFPVITAVSFSFLAKSVDITILKSAVLSSVLSLPATLAFLLAFYFCLERMGFLLTLAISFAAWLVVAFLVYLLKP
jgi:uncharacterized membrane protein (GlpM family)